MQLLKAFLGNSLDDVWVKKDGKTKLKHLRFHLGDSTLCCTTMIDILDDMEIEKLKKLDNEWELNITT
jgi:hypothetical protein